MSAEEVANALAQARKNLMFAVENGMSEDAIAVCREAIERYESLERPALHEACEEFGLEVQTIVQGKAYRLRSQEVGGYRDHRKFLDFTSLGEMEDWCATPEGWARLGKVFG